MRRIGDLDSVERRRVGKFGASDKRVHRAAEAVVRREDVMRKKNFIWVRELDGELQGLVEDRIEGAHLEVRLGGHPPEHDPHVRVREPVAVTRAEVVPFVNEGAEDEGGVGWVPARAPADGAPGVQNRAGRGPHRGRPALG
eukprot:gene10654-biopygen835